MKHIVIIVFVLMIPVISVAQEDVVGKSLIQMVEIMNKLGWSSCFELNRIDHESDKTIYVYWRKEHCYVADVSSFIVTVKNGFVLSTTSVTDIHGLEKALSYLRDIPKDCALGDMCFVGNHKVFLIEIQDEKSFLLYITIKP